MSLNILVVASSLLRKSFKNFLDFINPDSLLILPHAKGEPGLQSAEIGQGFQFEREGYFCLDRDSTAEKPVFNQTISLKDSFEKHADD